MIRAVARFTLLVWAIGSVAISGWLLSQHPFARPFAERRATEARAAFERAMARDVTPDWLDARLAGALAEGDLERVGLLLDIGADHGLGLPERHRAAIAALNEAHSGWVAELKGCGACAVDITACAALGQIASCALPFELSPAGDVNALRRAGVAWVAGEDVDEIEAGLATLGLGATAAVIASAGSSITVKFGATVLRMARRTGALRPGLMRAIRVSAGDGGKLTAILGDLGRVRSATSSAETLVLLRHADNALDLARLSRTAEAAGSDTRKVFEVLGKARTFRLLDRVTGLAILTVGFLALAAGQLLTLVLAALKLMLRTGLRPRPTARRGPVA